MRGLRCRRSLLLAGLAFAGAILVMIGATPGTFMVRRPASEYERVLYYFAQNVGEPNLCDHISWAAYARYSVMFGGGGASYDRSDCYERVAEARYDPSVCWRVRPLLDLNPLSSGYSALSCRRRTRARYQTGIALNDALLIRTFERMGYDIDQMSIHGLIPPAIRAGDMHEGEGEWGYSALVEVDGHRILYDTGASADRVAKNAAALHIDLSDVQPHELRPRWAPRKNLRPMNIMSSH